MDYRGDPTDFMVSDDDNDGISDVVEVAAGRNPKLNDAALISIISIMLQ